MGKMEKRTEDRLRKTKMNKAVLGAIAAAGVLSVGLVAPNVLSLLGGKTKLLPQWRYRVKTTLGRMIQKGYAKIDTQAGGKVVMLTEKGERFADLMREGDLMPKKPVRWDGKWRFVTYDVKGQAYAVRARIRELLRGWGFVMLHQSLWVYPYDCEDLVFLLKQEFRLGKGLLYLIAEEVEGDKALRAHFNLPPVKE